ncbi:MAG: flagellar biosynthesis anti-sigma factor FlgM [Acidobacteria bacterium]|nr:flagellar biosynthesis anti-sigma factor FlgM [Acidobacteriota bacterium]
MKIDGGAPSLDPAAARRAEDAAAAGKARGGRPREAGAPDDGDRVELSADAAFVSGAIRAAASAPDIRQDVVDRLRAKLAAGEIGSDAERLAERIIDSLLKVEE